MIGFCNVDMVELRIHTPAERVAIAEGHLFRVAFAIFFQLSQAAEFQDVPLFPGVFFLPGNPNITSMTTSRSDRADCDNRPVLCGASPER